MALYRVRDVKKVFMELRRVLSDGGYLIVREQDCRSPQFAAYLDIVYYVYAAIVNKEIEVGKGNFENIKKHKFATTYRARKAWEAYLARYGLESVGYTSIMSYGRKDRFNGYFEIFRLRKDGKGREGPRSPKCFPPPRTAPFRGTRRAHVSSGGTGGSGVPPQHGTHHRSEEH